MDPEETQGTPTNPEEKTLKAPLDPDEETQKAPPNLEEETREAPSDLEMKTNDIAGLAAGSTYSKGLVVPARRKLPISGNLPSNNVIAHVESTGVRRRERSSVAKLSADEQGRRPETYVDVRQRGRDDFVEEGGGTGIDSKGHVTGVVNRQQAMNALEMEE